MSSVCGDKPHMRSLVSKKLMDGYARSPLENSAEFQIRSPRVARGTGEKWVGLRMIEPIHNSTRLGKIIR